MSAERSVTANPTTEQQHRFVEEWSEGADWGDPWPEVNLDYHSDLKDGEYPRAMDADNFDPGRSYKSFGHLLGDRTASISMLPDIQRVAKTVEARADFSLSEKMALIDEDGAAGNAHKLNLDGTHYVSDASFTIDPNDVGMDWLGL